MALSIKVGSFTKKTSTGAQAVTGVGFLGKAVIFFSVGSTAAATFSGNGLGPSVGMATGTGAGGTGQRAQATGSADASVTSAAQQQMVQRAIELLNSAGTIVGAATLTSFDADGFTLNWSVADANAYLISYVVIGGADLTNAKVHDFNLRASLGAIAVTGIGFQPDLVLFLTASTVQTTIPYSAAGARLVLGVMDAAGNQWSLANFAADGVSPSSSVRQLLTDSCIINQPTAGGAPTAKVSFTSMDADGYTLNQTSAFNASIVAALALKGGSWKVGSTVKPVGGAPAAHAITGVGFVPKGVILAGIQAIVGTLGSTHAEVGIAALSAVGSEQAVASVDRDSISPTVAKRYSNSKSFVKVDNATSTVDAAAALTSLDADGLTLSWNPNDAVATQLGWIAGGDTGAAPSGGSYSNINRWTNRPFFRGGF